MKTAAKLFPGMAALAAIAAVGALTGCSSSAMSSMPLWDRDDPPDMTGAENRVNAWPVYYSRNGANSLLWPLVSWTPDGHAVIPFYETLYNDKTVRVGAVHQYIPALGVLDRKLTYWRFLNVVRHWPRDEHDDSAFWIVPFWFQNFSDKRLFVLPLVYREKSEFWTPLVTHTDHTDGVAGPLFFRYREDGAPGKGNESAAQGYVSWHFPFPFVRLWSGGERPALGMISVPGEKGFYAFPLFGFGSGEDELHLNFATILADWHSTSERKSFHGLWPLGRWMRSEDETLHYLIPLWFRHKNAEQDTILSLPWIHMEGDEGEVTNIGLPLYLELKNGDDFYRTIAFPFFHQVKNEGGGAQALLPIFYTSLTADGVRTIITPLASGRSDGSMINVAGPVFYSSRDEQGGEYGAALWPLVHWWRGESRGSAVLPLYYFERGESGDERLLVTPLGGMFRDSQGGGSAVVPFYFSSRNKVTDVHLLITPLGGMLRDGGSTMIDVLGPIYFQAREPDSVRRDILWPLIHTSSGGEERKTRFLPFFTYSRSPRSMLFTWMLLGGVSRNESDYWKRSANWFFPIYGWWRDDESVKLRTLPFYVERSRFSREELAKEISDTTRAPYSGSVLSHVSVLFGLFRERSWMTAEWPQKRYDAPAAAEATAAGEGAAEDEVAAEVEASPEAEAAPEVPTAIRLNRSGHFFPFYSHSSTEGAGGKFNILWRLYDSDRRFAEDGTEYLRRRVLWRFYHRERRGDRVTTDMFPFLAWDKGPGLRKFSFLGGLFERESSDRRKGGKVFYVPYGTTSPGPEMPATEAPAPEADMPEAAGPSS